MPNYFWNYLCMDTTISIGASCVRIQPFKPTGEKSITGFDEIQRGRMEHFLHFQATYHQPLFMRVTHT